MHCEIGQPYFNCGKESVSFGLDLSRSKQNKNKKMLAVLIISIVQFSFGEKKRKENKKDIY